MIMRVFTAHPKTGLDKEFARKLIDVSVPLVLQQPGIIGHYVGGPSKGREQPVFQMITLWRDLESVRNFAGEKWQEPVLPAGYEELLEHSEVTHYEILSWKAPD
ncbi:MAG: hypothetical protein WD942_11335 [Dehalococcoidia bacterium]